MCDASGEPAPGYLELEDQVARLTRERDEARERAESLSRELLAAIQARDSYRASAELRVGMRREVGELLGVRDTTGEEAFARGLARLRDLLAAESRAERLEEALEEIVGNENDPGMARECRDVPHLRRREWCPSCIARAALAAKEGK